MHDPMTTQPGSYSTRKQFGQNIPTKHALRSQAVPPNTSLRSICNMPATTFPQFSSLAKELRDAIWLEAASIQYQQVSWEHVLHALLYRRS
jgi:hypothetical protein